MREKSNIPRPGRRELRVAENVAQALPAGQLTQLEREVNDPDNLCWVCGQPVTDAIAEAVVLAEPPMTLARVAHTECLASGVYLTRGLQQRFEAELMAPGAGLGMQSLLAYRDSEPRALLFLEPMSPFAIAGRDPIERFAELLELSPVSDQIEELAPPRTTALTIGHDPEGIALRHRVATDHVSAQRSEHRKWWKLAQGEALVIVARGLGIRRGELAVDEALRFRPAWAAVASLEAVTAPSRWGGAAHRLIRALGRPA